MDRDQFRILEIIKRCFTGENSQDEKGELEDWLNESPAHQAFFDSVREGTENEKRNKIFARINEKEALKRFDRKIGYRRVVTWFRRIGYAAAIMIPVVVVLSLLRQTEPVRQVPGQTVVLPGKKQATLILSSGNEVLLQVHDSLREIVRYPGVKVTNGEGNLVYVDSVKQGGELPFNELITPRGGEYQVTLADGTVVWLNADSRLRYPVSFDGDKREVYFTGEAYFQVKKDVGRPFYVTTGDARVRVYGTEFNVNTRQQKLFRTTLIEGEVGITVNNKNEEMMLVPNQMLEYNPVTGSVEVKNVDVYGYIAWKSGEFMFDSERLEDIMEQLRLWYDVEVFYEHEELKNVKFTGNITRFVDIRSVLNILEKTRSVGFSISGRNLTVYRRKE